MNSVMHPSGPEPQQTYWIRRGILLGAAVLSLALIWWVLASLFGGGDDEAVVSATPQNPASLDAGSPSPSPSPSASTSPSASSSPSTTATPSTTASASATPTPTPTPSAPVACTAPGLRLAVTGERTPRLGGSQPLQVQLTNTGAAACDLDLATTPVQVLVTSGADRIWNSAHCAKWAPAGKTRLQPGKAFTTTVTWPLRRSADGCTLRPEALRPGTYRATASLSDGSNATLVMDVRG